MRILLFGDASNAQAILASALAREGNEVTLASEGCLWMHTARDIDISRRPGRLGGALLYLRLSTILARDLKGYDIVLLSSPNFVPLRPVRQMRLLQRLKRDNGRLFATALGTDSIYVRNLTGPNPALGYSEWQVGGHPAPWSDEPQARRQEWLAKELADYTSEYYDSLEGVCTVLYEYHKVLEAERPDLRLRYTGLPIDIDALPRPRTHSFGSPVKVYYACHRGREHEKGADLLLDMVRMAEAELPGRLEVLTPSNMPYADFVRFLTGTDIVLDQAYSYTPAMTALLGMATGVVPASGGEEEFYRFIGQDSSLRPIFNVDPRDMEGTYLRFRALIQNPEQLRQMSAQGPGFVRRHNDAALVARRYLDFWNE